MTEPTNGERRKMDMDLRERLASTETHIRNIKESIKDHHTENLIAINKIFEKLDNRPCDVHAGKIHSNSNLIAWLFTIVIVVIVGGVVFGIWMKV